MKLPKKEEISNSWYCTCILALYITVSAYTVGVSWTSLNPVTAIIERMYNETYMARYGEAMNGDSWTLLLSLTMSVLIVGALVGSLFMKSLLDKFTRKQTMVIVHIVNVIGHIVIAVGGQVWGSYEAFITGRFIIGLSNGVGTGLTAIIVSELSVPHQRLFYGSVLGAAYIVGAPFGAFIGWPKVLGSQNLWGAVVLFGCLMSIVYLSVAYWIPDTPFQVLLSRGSRDSIILLKKLRSESKELSNELEPFSGKCEEIDKCPHEEVGEATLRAVLKNPQYRKHFFGVIIVFSYITSSGMSNILFFSDLIFIRAGLAQDFVTPATIGVLSIGAFASLASIGAMKKFDPKTLLLFGSVLIIFGDVFLTASMATYNEEPTMSICSIVAMGLFYIGYSIISSSSCAVIGVLCVDKTRSACMFVATLSYWFCAWFVGFISPYFAKWLGPYAFLIWMGVTISITFYIGFYVPKTKGKTEDEIQAFYKNE